MWPDQAAAEAKSSWLTLFAQFDDPVPWDEISENVKQGNVVGSGCGYSLLHAFVKHGHELAVMLLISKGADVNAILTNGCTGLYMAVECQNLNMVTGRTSKLRVTVEIRHYS